MDAKIVRLDAKITSMNDTVDNYNIHINSGTAQLSDSITDSVNYDSGNQTYDHSLNQRLSDIRSRGESGEFTTTAHCGNKYSTNCCDDPGLTDHSLTDNSTTPAHCTNYAYCGSCFSQQSFTNLAAQCECLLLFLWWHGPHVSRLRHAEESQRFVLRVRRQRTFLA